MHKKVKKMKLISSLLISTILMFSASTCQGKSPLKMADPKASATTVNLFLKMKELTKQGFMIGHQDDMAYGVGWKAPNGKSDVYKVCADYPAVFGWDLGHIEKGSPVNLDSVPFSDMAKYAIEVNAMGGINTFSWHLDNPLTGGSAWDVTKNGVVKSILPGGANHAEFNNWLDKVAAFFLGLKDKNDEAIPVIFRPFHENTGNWFWWGKVHCTSDEYKQIWIYTINYLTETKNLHNLIFAYSPAGSFKNLDEYSERYPGNDYVDIAGFDIYQDAGQRNSVFARLLKEKLTILNEFSKANDKLAAITEIGFEQIPEPKWWTGVIYPVTKDYNVSYALFWRNAANKPNHYYMPYPGQKSETDFRDFYSLPGTLFLKDIEKTQIHK
jgi:mannan endo-1,4-beta-mannosidase